MRQRWLELTEVGHHDVAAALIREGQLEMAVDKIEEMRRNGLNIRPWLSDMAIYALAESGEFDEALQLLKNQIASWDSDISKAVWSHLLDTASSAFHVGTLLCTTTDPSAHNMSSTQQPCTAGSTKSVLATSTPPPASV